MAYRGILDFEDFPTIKKYDDFVSANSRKLLNKHSLSLDEICYYYNIFVSVFRNDIGDSCLIDDFRPSLSSAVVNYELSKREKFKLLLSSKVLNKYSLSLEDKDIEFEKTSYSFNVFNRKNDVSFYLDLAIVSYTMYKLHFIKDKEPEIFRKGIVDLIKTGFNE